MDWTGVNAQSAGCRSVPRFCPGRLLRPLDEGRPMRDRETLARIKSLAIPPA